MTVSSWLNRQTLIAAACIVFLAWFSMKFYMDNSNDSETEAYARALMSSAAQGTVTTDGTGHYVALAPFVLWPFAAALQVVTGAYLIRGFVFARFFMGLVLYAAAYAWYRRLGLGWFTSLVGLMLLSTSVAFALLDHGWELDKVIEPALFLLAAIAAWNRRPFALVVLAVLAAANRETGAFVVLVALAGWARRPGGLGSALKQWPVWACAIVCAAEVAWLRRFDVAIVSSDVSVERLVTVIGGFCLLPVLGLAWLQAAPLAVRRLVYLLVPIWMVFILATDHLSQGAVLFTPLALLFVPLTLGGVEQLVRTPPKLLTPLA